MIPSSFTFKLTVPRDPTMGPVVADVAAHAVTYAAMDKAAGAEFVEKVTAASAQELSAAETGNAGIGSKVRGCQIVFTSADGELRCTVGGHIISQRISA